MPYTLNRRRALQLLGCAAAIAVSAPRRVWAFVVQAFRTRTVEHGTFTFDPAAGKVRYDDGREEDYALTIGGLVDEPVTLTYAQLLALPQTRQTSDFHCVEGWSVLDVHWSGVTFKDLLATVSPKPEARYIVFHSLGETGYNSSGVDHYMESFPIDWLLNRELGYLFALGLDGAPLPKDRGAPARVVCPYDLAYKSIKFVTRMELTAEKQPGWWTLANPIYPWRAPVPARRLRTAMPPRS